MTAPNDGVWRQWLAGEEARRGAADLSRSVEIIEPRGQLVVDLNGRQFLNYMSNDYLGMSRHPDVMFAAAQSLERGSGAASARLMAGTDAAYCALEDKLARFHNTEGALIFGSGYLTNLGTIRSIVSRDDAVFSDRLNHASIIDGCLLSGSHLYRYRHCDTDHLEALLQEADRRGHRRKLIVTESVFSMDGDVAPLSRILELRDRFDAALMVDEAHALGVFGPGGRGYADGLGIASAIDLRVGTFGKALGSYGAYVVAQRQWIDHLLNTARTFLFSTALPPPIIGSVDVSLDLVRADDVARLHIRTLANRFRAELTNMGLNVLQSQTQIVPVIVGSSARAVEISRELRASGILVRAIRPPTVPRNSSRLRFSITSLLTDDDITHTVRALQGCIHGGKGNSFL